MKVHPEKRLGRRGSREAIDWIDAVQQLEGSICPRQFECLQLFALILTDRPALGIYGGGLARCFQLFSSSCTNKAHTNRFPPKSSPQILIQLNALRRTSHHNNSQEWTPQAPIPRLAHGQSPAGSPQIQPTLPFCLRPSLYPLYC